MYFLVEGPSAGSRRGSAGQVLDRAKDLVVSDARAASDLILGNENHLWERLSDAGGEPRQAISLHKAQIEFWALYPKVIFSLVSKSELGCQRKGRRCFPAFCGHANLAKSAIGGASSRETAMVSDSLNVHRLRAPIANFVLEDDLGTIRRLLEKLSRLDHLGAFALERPPLSDH